jgi:hypothetical protein
MNDRPSMPDADAIVTRIMAEAARRAGAAPPEPHRTLRGPAAAPDLWEPPPDWAERRRFSAAELCAPPDERFVRGAYLALIGRSPDPAGLHHYLGELRSGARSKPDVLIALSASPEARMRGAQVSGLGGRRLMLRVARVPVAGPLLAALLRLRRLPRLPADIQRLEAACEQLLLRTERLEAGERRRQRPPEEPRISR